MKRFSTYFFAITCSLLCVNWLTSPVTNLLNKFLSALSPLIIGIIVAYFLNHAVKFYERLLAVAVKKEQFKRILSVLLGILSVIAIIVAIVILCLPAIVDNVNDLVSNLPQYLEKVKKICSDVDSSLNLSGNISLSALLSTLDENALNNYASNFAPKLLPVVSNLAISLLLAVLILIEKDDIIRALKKFTDRVFKNPERIKEGAGCTLVILDGYVYGKIIEGLITGGLFTVLYFVFGIQYALLFGFFMGILFVIPYVGGYLALVPPILVLLNTSSHSIVLFLLIGVGLLNIVGSVISPLIFKNKLKVSALTITASVIVGGSAFGIVGFLLAPPVVATVKAFFSVFINSKVKKSQ